MRVRVIEEFWFGNRYTGPTALDQEGNDLYANVGDEFEVVDELTDEEGIPCYVIAVDNNGDQECAKELFEIVEE